MVFLEWKRLAIMRLSSLTYVPFAVSFDAEGNMSAKITIGKLLEVHFAADGQMYVKVIKADAVCGKALLEAAAFVLAKVTPADAENIYAELAAGGTVTCTAYSCRYALLTIYLTALTVLNADIEAVLGISHEAVMTVITSLITEITKATGISGKADLSGAGEMEADIGLYVDRTWADTEGSFDDYETFYDFFLKHKGE